MPLDMTRFHKMHGLGNDFVIFDAREGAVAMDAARARAIADRHMGVGCDQVILLEPSDIADVRMRIWNADGGEVEACGNATRCVAMLGAATIETKGGLLGASADGAGATIDMGLPRFGWDEIPLAYAMDTAAMPEFPVGPSPEPPHATREAKTSPRTIVRLINRPRDTTQGNVAPHSREPWRETAPRDGRIAFETSSVSGGMSTRRQSAIFPKIHPVRRRR